MNTVQYRQGSRFVSVNVQAAVAPIEDWDSSILFPGGMNIVAIEMLPTAINDVVAILDGPLGAGYLFNHRAISIYDIAVRYYGRHDKFGFKGVHCTPLIFIGACGGTFTVTFELA